MCSRVYVKQVNVVRVVLDVVLVPLTLCTLHHVMGLLL